MQPAKMMMTPGMMGQAQNPAAALMNQTGMMGQSQTPQAAMMQNQMGTGQNTAAAMMAKTTGAGAGLMGQAPTSTTTGLTTGMGTGMMTTQNQLQNQMMMRMAAASGMMQPQQGMMATGTTGLTNTTMMQTPVPGVTGVTGMQGMQMPYQTTQGMQMFPQQMMMQTGMGMMNAQQQLMAQQMQLQQQQQQQQTKPQEVVTRGPCTVYLAADAIPLGPPRTDADPNRPRCRTLFVGGVPAPINLTNNKMWEPETDVRALFSCYGEVRSVRVIPGKAIAFIEYRTEDSAESALLELHHATVDFNTAGVRTMFNVEYSETELARATKRRRMDPESNYTAFSSTRLKNIGTELAENEALPKAMTDLAQWLKRGECNKKEVTNFYTALHHAHTHARRIFWEVDWQLSALLAQRENYVHLTMGVFYAATAQKVLDLMTKPQRKKIKEWYDAVEEFKKLPAAAKEEEDEEEKKEKERREEERRREEEKRREERRERERREERRERERREERRERERERERQREKEREREREKEKEKKEKEKGESAAAAGEADMDVDDVTMADAEDEKEGTSAKAEGEAEGKTEAGEETKEGETEAKESTEASAAKTEAEVEKDAAVDKTDGEPAATVAAETEIKEVPAATSEVDADAAPRTPPAFPIKSTKTMEEEAKEEKTNMEGVETEIKEEEPVETKKEETKAEVKEEAKAEIKKEESTSVKEGKKLDAKAMETALTGALAGLLVGYPVGATVSELGVALRRLHPDLTNKQVRSTLEANPAIFGATSKSGLWRFIAYDTLKNKSY